jgi:hypothetical protein
MDDTIFQGIRFQVHVITEVLHIGLPTDRRLEAYLEWLRIHWEGV